MVTNKELERMLSLPQVNNENLPEDLLIIQEDGARACVNWELRGRGYHLFKYEKNEELSDEELLKSAYLELQKSKFSSQ